MSCAICFRVTSAECGGPDQSHRLPMLSTGSPMSSPSLCTPGSPRQETVRANRRPEPRAEPRATVPPARYRALGVGRGDGLTRSIQVSGTRHNPVPTPIAYGRPLPSPSPVATAPSPAYLSIVTQTPCFAGPPRLSHQTPNPGPDHADLPHIGSAPRCNGLDAVHHQR